MLHRILLYLICAIASFAILVNAAANFLEENSPEISVGLNPFNTNARIRLILEQLATAENGNYDEVTQSIQEGMSKAPIDARLISLDGLIAETSSGIDSALPKYAKSLAILPTEFQALLRMISYQYAENSHVKALNLINGFIRRWPKKGNQVEAFIPALTSSDEGFKRANVLFETSAPMRILLISALAKNPDTLSIATKLVQHSSKKDKKEIWRLGNFIVDKLFKEKRYKQAYLVFRSFLSSTELARAKYVYNENFDSKPSGSIFDWRFRKQAGVTNEIKALNNSPNSDDKSNILEIKFHNTPLQYRGPSQQLVLSAGAHILNINYESRNLKTPKPVKVDLKCLQKRDPLATYEFNGLDSEKQSVSLSFFVPSTSCDLVTLSIGTDFVAKSWSNLFSGILNIYKISVQKEIN